MDRGGQAYRDAIFRRLELMPGAVVLDFGCGTGLNFAALEDQIGPGGGVIGIDLSPGCSPRRTRGPSATTGRT